jgi:hypothetical protein
VHALAVGAAIFCALLGAAFVPLFVKDRIARFWAAGLLISIVPAATTFPHNRHGAARSIRGIARGARCCRTPSAAFGRKRALRPSAPFTRFARIYHSPKILACRENFRE